MRFGAWIWASIRGRIDSVLVPSLWLVAAPACLVVLFLVVRPGDGAAHVRFAHAERWIEPLAGYSFDKAGFTALLHAVPNLSAARWTPMPLPDVVLAPAISSDPDQPEMARAWLRVRYTPPATATPGEPLALYGTRIMGGAWSVWVNGELLETSLDDWRMQWNRPLLAKLPLRHSLAGKPIDIVVAVPYRVAQGYAVGTLSAGPLSALRPLNDSRVFFQSTLPQAGILVALLLGLLSFQFWLARPSETAHLLLTLTAIAWFVFNLQYFFDFSADEVAARWFGALVDAAAAWLLAFLYLSAFRFEQRRFPRLEKALLGYALGVSLVALPLWQWHVTALLLQHTVDLLLGVGVTGLLTWLALRGGSLEFRIITLALWSLAAFAAHDLWFLSSQRSPDGVHLFPYATFLLFGAFLFSLQRRYLGALDGIDALNASLEQRLREREADVEARHGQLRQVEQQKALLQERQRLMQDMHDGLGSALVSSLVIVEQGRLPLAALATLLRECVDELRLVIDSLDPVTQDLVSLLATLRHRLGDRLADAGIRIDWAMADLPPLPWLEPPQALQVLRIVQEALTNVLKHARASELRIAARHETDTAGQQVVIVEIADDGVGFSPLAATAGRGLRNMRERARRLGGALAVTAAAGEGTRVELRLPVAPDAPAALATPHLTTGVFACRRRRRRRRSDSG